MTPTEYALFICLCAVEKTPEKEYERNIKSLDEEYDDCTKEDFVYKVKTTHGHHFVSKREIEAWLAKYRKLSGTTGPFWSEEKAKELGINQ